MKRTFIIKLDIKNEDDFCESDLQDAIIDGIENIGNYELNKVEEINMIKKLKIPFSKEDLEHLNYGGTFDWCFDGVDIHLYGAEEDEVEE